MFREIDIWAVWHKLKDNKRNNKILLVSHEMTYTGAPRSLLNMALVLKKQNYQVTVWSLKSGSFENEFLLNDIKVISINDKWDIKEIMEFDLVIANTIFCIRFAQKAQKYSNTVLFLREAHNIPELLDIIGEKRETLESILNVACISEYAQKFISQYYHIKDIYVLYNYVKDNYRYRLNFVRNNVIHFAVIGTVEIRKQQGMVIQAFKEMPLELRKKSMLHIIGKCPEWSRAYWSSFPALTERVLYHGEISDEEERIKLYKKMNVFIVSSTDEACSLAALEGAMLGKAVILSSHVGAGYLSSDKKYIYDVDDISQLTRKICQLTSRKELLVEGIKMRKSYRKMASVNSYRRNIGNFLKWIEDKKYEDGN